jgi:two-component system sensor kinase FixL
LQNGTQSKQRTLSLDRLWEPRNRILVLALSGTLIAVIALIDWGTKPFISLGFLYLFPVMLAAGFVPRWVVALLAVTCAFLSEAFSGFPPSSVRLLLEALALVTCGFLITELVRNRRGPRASQEMLRALVENSPVAIVTVNERGFIELANDAAAELMAPRDGCLVGNPIAAFLPQLHQALRWEEGPQFRASMQCRGHRGTGELFDADVCFSTYKEGRTSKLAAVIRICHGA